MKKLMPIVGLLSLLLVGCGAIDGDRAGGEDVSGGTAVCEDVSAEERDDARKTLKQAGYERSPEAFLQVWNEQDQDRINQYWKAGIAQKSGLIDEIGRRNDLRNMPELIDTAIDCADVKPKILIKVVLKYDQNPKFLKALLDAGADVNKPEKLYKTLLIKTAANSDNPEIVEVLLASGNDLVEEKFIVTPLMAAAAFNEDPRMIKTLIDAGWDVNGRDKRGLTPLMYAAQSNENPAVFEALLDAGANVNARDKHGWTPLMFAAGHNQPEIVETLLDAGADASVENDYGGSALDFAEFNDDLRGTEVYDELKEKAAE